MTDSNEKPAEASKTSGGLKTPTRNTVSHVFPDGTLAEMVYSQATEHSGFVVAKDGVITTEPSLLIGRDGHLTSQEVGAILKHVPSWMLRDHVKKDFMHVAERANDYGTVAELHNEVRSIIQKYVVLEDTRFYDISAGYVLMTWVYDRFNTVPYLRVVGDFGSGKSRFLEVVGKMCNRALMASSISPAAIYRTLDKVDGTLVYDEADFKSSDMTDDIVKLLNSGHRKGAPVVRMEIKNDIPITATFRVFGPKILGSRQNWSDTALESRCISQRLFPSKHVDVPVHLPPEFDVEAQVLRNKLLMFRLKNYHAIRDDESTVDCLEFPRLKQTALALTSVVKMVNAEALASVQEFLADYQKRLSSVVSTNVNADILLCIARLVESNPEIKSSGKLYMKAIAIAFNDSFYDDYAERETRTVQTKDSMLYVPGQRVSPKKIGGYVERLGLAKERDGGGIYIPLRTEWPRFVSMLERHDLVRVLEEEHILDDEKKRSSKKTPRTDGDFVEDGGEPTKA